MALTLVLFSRTGCCLCQQLEQRLRRLELPWPLEVRRIDADPALRLRYDLEVPVLAAADPGSGGWRDLPRPSPRLQGEALGRWLERAMATAAQARLGPPSSD
ncbi:glutaredoxin family protein [Synechococcus sp. RSCCF101]|uniref:glutaredoxin family protein n=1 Tax=Synechococcus sp. RSCCF101 TaxID=2511069 RepID=UPI00124823F9|nr:glutaredoxin family protein [Synechococcus sp. RSCCF101]QEY30916.1 glutaredoxin family protein [Synechococcus sp. RSCCF101]